VNQNVILAKKLNALHNTKFQQNSSGILEGKDEEVRVGFSIILSFMQFEQRTHRKWKITLIFRKGFSQVAVSLNRYHHTSCRIGHKRLLWGEIGF
jgi:hypothetical protein